MTISYLSITPHDPIIARDGRPFGAGVRMKSLDWPYPSVLAGSVRTAIGKMHACTFDKCTFKPETVSELKKIAIHGPLPLFRDMLYFPAPKDVLVKDSGNKKYETYAIRPAKLGDGEYCDLPQKDLMPAMLPERAEEDFKPAKIAPLWSAKKMEAWLTNPAGKEFTAPLPLKEYKEGSPGLDFPQKESRFHVEIDPGLGSSREGMLFETVGLDFSLKGHKKGIRLAAKIKSGEMFKNLISNQNSINTIGGERRLAWWETMDSPPEGWVCPEAVKKALNNSTKIRMVLATPALFTRGWCPGWIDEEKLTGTPPGVQGLNLKLVSACIDRWKPLSGWNMEKGHKRGPKPLRRLVPAGSVYFFEVGKPGDGETLADLWLESVSDEFEEGQEQRDGFGLALWGTWDYDTNGLINEQKKEG